MAPNFVPPAPPRRALSQRQIVGLAVLLVIACVLPFVLGNYRVFQLTLALPMPLSPRIWLTWKFSNKKASISSGWSRMYWVV